MQSSFELVMTGMRIVVGVVMLLSMERLADVPAVGQVYVVWAWIILLPKSRAPTAPITSFMLLFYRSSRRKGGG